MTKRFVLTALMFTLIGCGDSASDDQYANVKNSLLNCSTNELGLSPLLNTCGLGWVGPFGAEDGSGDDDTPIEADPDPGFAAAEPAFAAPQVVYTVELPGSGTGAVKFTAEFSQDYSIATDTDVDVAVVDSLGNDVSPLFQQDISDDCSAAAEAFPAPLPGTAMASLSVFPLSAGSTYVVVFDNADDDTFHATIDEPNDFMNAYYPDTDGDGFGNYRAAPLITECASPSDHAANGDDCDDSNGDVFPGAPEVPGTGDNNCDTVPDGDLVATDLVMRDVTILSAPTELAIGGRAGRVEVRYRYANRGPALMDALVSTHAEGMDLSVFPDDVAFTAEDLMPVRIEEFVKTYHVKCPKPRKRHKHHHFEEEELPEVRTLTFSGEIQPADDADIDSLPANNTAEVIYDLSCIDCSQYRGRGFKRHGHFKSKSHHRRHRRHSKHEEVPEVCKKPRRHHGHHHAHHGHDRHHGHDHDGHRGHHGHGRMCGWFGFKHR